MYQSASPDSISEGDTRCLTSLALDGVPKPEIGAAPDAYAQDPGYSDVMAAPSGQDPGPRLL